MFKLRTFVPMCIALAMASCGGGGFGGTKTLTVSVSFPADAVNLYSVATIRPFLSGFEGYQQRCDQVSGALPEGMHINNDCSISGRPTQAGTFGVRFKVRAEDAEGSFESTAYVNVAAPSISYPVRQTRMKIGDAISDAPDTSG